MRASMKSRIARSLARLAIREQEYIVEYSALSAQMDTQSCGMRKVSKPVPALRKSGGLSCLRGAIRTDRHRAGDRFDLVLGATLS
jgi:hypothetical protein